MNELDRRKILACANSSCPFRVHPEAHLGGFCCTSCYSAWIAGLPVIHGPRCHQSKAAQWLPRAPPQAPGPPGPAGPAGPAGSVGAVISPAVVSPARAPILAPVAIPAIPAPAIPAIPAISAISAIRGATGATPKIIPGRKRPAENLAPPKAPVVSRAKVHAHGGHGHVVGAVPKARGVPLQNGMHNGWKMWTNGCLGREMAHTQDFWSGDAMEELDAENMGLYEDQLWNDFGLDGAAAEMEPTMDPWSFPQVPPAAPAPAAPPARGVLIRPARRPEAPVTAGNAAPVTEVEDEVDPALAAVLELGLSEEPAPAEAELSEVPPAAPAPAAPPARGVLIRPARRPEAPVTAGNAAPVTEVEDEVDPALAAVLGLGLSEEPAEAAPAEAELSEAEEQLFPEGDPVAKTSVASSMDYVAVREDATTKAEAAVNVGLARLADVKYLRRNFRKRPPCGFAFVPDPRNDLHSVCRRCLCVSSPFGTCTAPAPMEPMEPIEPMEEAHVAAAIDMDAEMAKLLAEINSVAEPTPDMPLHPRVTVTAPLNGTLL